MIKKKQKTINCCLKKTNDFSMHLQKEIEVSYIFLKTEIFTFGACLEKRSIYSYPVFHLTLLHVCEFNTNKCIYVHC